MPQPYAAWKALDLASVNTQAAQLILAPTKSLDYRIPALARLNGEVLLFADARPQPDEALDWQRIGGAMAADLPNPNYLVYLRFHLATRAWGNPVRLSGTPAACGDAATVVTRVSGKAEPKELLTLCYAASQKVGYFGSSYAGDRLEAWVACGEDAGALKHRRLDEIYERLHCDAAFATSGSVVAYRHPEFEEELAVFPFVIRVGEETHLRLVFFLRGEIVQISEPIADGSLGRVDETALVVDGEDIVLSIRRQHEGGRIWGRWNPRGISALSLDNAPDPGCNACLIRLGNVGDSRVALIHPHHGLARENGVVWDVEKQRVLHQFSAGEFGYSDSVRVDEHTLLVVFERDGGLMAETLRV